MGRLLLVVLMGASFAGQALAVRRVYAKKYAKEYAKQYANETELAAAAEECKTGGLAVLKQRRKCCREVSDGGSDAEKCVQPGAAECHPLGCFMAERTTRGPEGKVTAKKCMPICEAWKFVSAENVADVQAQPEVVSKIAAQLTGKAKEALQPAQEEEQQEAPEEEVTDAKQACQDVTSGKLRCCFDACRKISDRLHPGEDHLLTFDCIVPCENR
mmetsp:Transcript_41098/g.128089  ORF Transcript_41098/g.128089 Transcript_41098/m.128089 type:complete len:215 (-) Transcript_41098:232-876(-)